MKNILVFINLFLFLLTCNQKKEDSFTSNISGFCIILKSPACNGSQNPVDTKAPEFNGNLEYTSTGINSGKVKFPIVKDDITPNEDIYKILIRTSTQPKTIQEAETVSEDKILISGKGIDRADVNYILEGEWLTLLARDNTDKKAITSIRVPKTDTTSIPEEIPIPNGDNTTDGDTTDGDTTDGNTTDGNTTGGDTSTSIYQFTKSQLPAVGNLISAIDTEGNLYVAGSFYGKHNFAKAWGGEVWKQSLGFDGDIYLQKINKDGSFGWLRRIGGSGRNFVRKIITDSGGNILLFAYFNGDINFRADFGGTDSRSSYFQSAFITKIGPDGSYHWTKLMQEKDDNKELDIVSAVRRNNTNFVYACTNFWGNYNPRQDFDSTSESFSSYKQQILISKFNGESYYKSFKIGTGNTEVLCKDMATDAFGNIYVLGSFNDTGTTDKVDFGSAFGSSAIRQTSDGEDYFLLRINPDDSLGDVKVFKGALRYQKMAVSPAGVLYLLGDTNGLVYPGLDFGNASPFPDTGTITTKIQAYSPITSEMQYLWSKEIIPDRFSLWMGNQIHVDASGNVYIGGEYDHWNMGDFNFGQMFSQDIYFNNDGQSGDGVLVKMDKEDRLIYVKFFEGLNCESIVNIESFETTTYIMGIAESQMIDFAKAFGSSDPIDRGKKDYYRFITKITE